MSRYSAIKAATNAYIKTNGRQEITGAILNAVMIATIDSLGKFYQFVGSAVPTTDPGAIDQNIAFLASTPGTYTHLGGIEVSEGEFAVIKFDGQWKKEVVIIVPSKVSQLENDLGFITNAVSDLVNYYTKSDTFTRSEIYAILANYYDKDEVDSLVSAIVQQSYVVAWDGTAEPVVGDIPAGVSVTWGGNPYVGTLPASADTANKIYLVSNGAGYDEYITTENGGYSWIALGTTNLDLSGYVTQTEFSQLDDEVNGGTETLTITASATKEDYRMPRNGGAWTQTSATGYNVDSFAVVAGKSYHLRVPKTGSQYTAVYEFGTTTALSPIPTGTLPSPVETGEYTNAEYDIVIPTGYSALYVCYEEASGSPILTTTQTTQGLVDRVQDLEGDYTSLEGRVEDIEEALDGREETISITPSKQEEGFRITHTGSVTNDASAENASIYTYPVTPGATCHLVVPTTKNNYNAVFAFATNDIVNTSAVLTLPDPVVRGDDGRYEGDILIPEGVSYLWVAFVTLGGSPSVTTTQIVGSLVNDVSELSDRVDELEEEIEGGEAIDINVPDVVFAVVGDKLQLYYESIFKVVNPFNYDIKVSCNIGSQYPRYFEVTPTLAQVGSYTLKFTIKNYSGETLGQKSATLKVVGSSATPTINVLCVGASTTNGGEWVGEMKKRLTTSAGTPTISPGGTTLFTPIGFSLPGVSFVGRKEANGAKFEATGGYNFNSYNGTTTYIAHFYFSEENLPNVSLGDVYSDGTNQFTITEINIPTTGTYAGNIGCSCAAKPHSANLSLTKVSGNGDPSLTASLFDFKGNPFLYDGVIDIEQYADDYCNGQIDMVFAYLFSNGLVTPYQTDFTSTLASMRTFINNFLSDFPLCKFGILLSQNKDARGGLGVNYGASESDIWTYEFGMKVANHNLLTALQEYITEEGLTNVFIVNNLNEFDYMNDYLQTDKQVNPRSPVTEIFGRNGVHPSTIGYYQIADSATRAFIGFYNQ